MQIKILKATRSRLNDQNLFVDVEIDGWVIIKGVFYSMKTNKCHLPTLETQKKIRFTPIAFVGDKHTEFKTLFVELIQDFPMPKKEEDNVQEKDVDRPTNSDPTDKVLGGFSGQKKDPGSSKPGDSAQLQAKKPR